MHDLDHFIRLAESKGGKVLSTSYTNCRTKLKFQCACTHEWEAEPRHITDGRWCPKCGSQSGRKYTVDDDFFSRDTEESFYVAGFWAADGWKTRKAGGGWTVGLQLCAADFDQLLKIKSILKCTSPYKFCKRKRNKTNTFSYTFVFNSQKAYNYLTRFAVVEQKTYVYKMPEWLLVHPLLRHFLRGYIDGDGCFNEHNSVKHGHNIRFSIRGTYMFLDQVQSLFIKHSIIESSTQRKMEPKAGKKYAVFDKLQCGGNATISRMYDYLYKDATIYMDRKKVLAEKSKELMVFGTDKTRKPNKNALPITKEILLVKAKELGSTKEIAKYFGCTAANISWKIKQLGIKKEMDIAKGVLDTTAVVAKYKELGTQKAVADLFGVTKSRIGQILKQAPA